MSRHAHCLFCDDIRTEVGNKTSLIGIYGGELFVDECPAVLPKICISAFMSTDAEQPLRTLTVQVSHKGAVLQENIVPEDQLLAMQQALLERGSASDPIRVFSIGCNIMFAPFVIDEESVLEVAMVADGDSHLAGKLRIRCPSKAAPNAPVSK